MHFTHPLLLLGLAAALIPPVVHLLARRRAEEVEWGAMRFLRLAQHSRRGLVTGRWLLPGLRTGVLALLAVALAGPAVRTTLGGPADPRPRDTVILIDCSGSMAARHADGTALDTARRWAADFLVELRPGDRVAVLAVKGERVPVVGALIGDTRQAAAGLESLPEPRGTADWPAAVEAAVRLLAEPAGEPEILVLTDGRRFGWADEEALARWEWLGRRLAAEDRALPRTWVVNVAPAPPPEAPHPVLLPITANRGLASAAAAVTFESGLRHTGADPLPRVRVEVDGRAAGEVPLPPPAQPASEFTFSFSRRFAPGSHVLTLRLDPPSPPGDRQDCALDVLPAIPVLVVDGEPQPGPQPSGSVFLWDALAPPRDTSPAFVVRTVPAARFTPAALAQDVKGPGTRPRVLVLSNLPALSAEQDAAVERFLADGGGALVTLGDRADAREWNRLAYRGGSGWLPARLVEVTGTEGDPAGPRPARFEHPALQVFREPRLGGLQSAHLPRYWRLEADPAVPGVEVLATLTNGSPLLVEKSVGGRAVVAAVPLDETWGTSLVGLPDFVRLTHELTYLLAAGPDPVTLDPGEPITFRPRDDEPPAPTTVLPPDGLPRLLSVRSWPAVFSATRDPGPYRLTTRAGKLRHYAVRADPREVDPTPVTTADLARVSQAVGGVEPVGSLAELEAHRGRGPAVLEVGGLLLVAALALLAAEVWYTRRLSRA